MIANARGREEKGGGGGQGSILRLVPARVFKMCVLVCDIRQSPHVNRRLSHDAPDHITSLLGHRTPLRVSTARREVAEEGKPLAIRAAIGSLIEPPSLQFAASTARMSSRRGRR